MSVSPPRYWQTLEEREDPESFGKTHADEFSELLPLGVPAIAASQPSRRELFKLLTASAAIAASACRRAPVQQAVPFAKAPAGVIAGTSQWFATACGGCGAGCGLLVKWRDGRPIKIEGNPEHPVSQGGVCAIGQAQVLGLYDADRARAPMVSGKQVTWAQLDTQVKAALAGSKTVRVMVPWLTGPLEDEALEAWLATMPGSRAVRFESGGVVEAIAEAQRLTVGRRQVPDYRLDDAAVVVSFGADFLGSFLSPVAFSRQWAKARSPERQPAPVTITHPDLEAALGWAKARAPERELAPLRHLQVEAALSLTGGNADQRFPMSSADSAATLFAVVTRLAEHSTVPEVASVRRWLESVRAPEGRVELPAVEAIAAALETAGARGLVLSGSASVMEQLLAQAANTLLGNGSTTARLATARQLDDNAMTLAALVEELKAGQVTALVFAGVNPVYAAPQAGPWDKWLAQVAVTVSTNDRRDETASLVRFHAPESQALESWGDVMARGDLRTLQQPLIAPLFETRERLSSFLTWAGLDANARTFARSHLSDADSALERGFVEGRATNARAVDFRAVDGLTTVAPLPAGTFELVKTVGSVGDGNNAWLQELPDPIAKTTWGNVLSVGPKDAKALGLVDGEVVKLSSEGWSAELPVLVQPGMAAGTVAAASGYGRRAAGRTGNGIGVDVHGAGRAVTLTKTGTTRQLLQSQTHASQEGREFAREFTLAELRAGKAESKEEKEESGHRGLWSGHAYPGHRWALAVDLNACTGCGACVIGCQSENNIPVVGAQEVQRRREMHWVRIDRYYSGEPDAPQVVHQPMMCQHCENAPCETVCPVAATVHSSEGLNQQVYNRCVGTRYCANNCPTKVRRFNWFDYRHDDALARMVLNPDVVVRERGVMEKCSFCVQRIEDARGRAQRENRSLRDGDVKTACQQSCPTQALTFGDANDAQSEVSKKLHDGRGYRVLGELNIGPQVTYLSKIRVTEES